MTSRPIPLQSLSVGQLLDRSLLIYRRHFLLFWLIFVIGQLPLVFTTGSALLSTYLPLYNLLSADVLEPIPGMGPWVTAVAWLGGALTAISQGVVGWLAARSWLGEPVTWRAALAALRRRWASLLGVWLFSYVLTAVAVVWWIVACVIGWFTGLGIMLFISAVIQPMALVVVMLEDRGAWAAIQRAWHLTRRRFWWSVSVALACALLTSVLSWGVQVAILGGLFALLEWAPLGDQWQTVLGVVAGGLTGVLAALILPLQIGAIVLFYFQLRVEQEGLDLALRLAPAESLPLTAVAAAPAPESDPLTPTRSDLWQFAGLSALPFLFVVLVYALVFGLVFLLAGV